jgi:hypothetical protein
MARGKPGLTRKSRLASRFYQNAGSSERTFACLGRCRRAPVGEARARARPPQPQDQAGAHRPRARRRDRGGHPRGHFEVFSAVEALRPLIDHSENILATKAYIMVDQRCTSERVPL